MVNEPIFCDACGARFHESALSSANYALLQELHHGAIMETEWAMLLRVERLYQAHPGLEEAVHDFHEREWRRRAENQKTAYETGRPYQREWGQFNASLSEGMSEDEREVMGYLRRNVFSLGPRMEFVRAVVTALRPRLEGKRVACPQCAKGNLKIDPARWHDPNCLYD